MSRRELINRIGTFMVLATLFIILVIINSPKGAINNIWGVILWFVTVAVIYTCNIVWMIIERIIVFLYKRYIRDIVKGVQDAKEEIQKPINDTRTKRKISGKK